LGKFGVMTELTFKVFPRPETYSTLLLKCESTESAIDCMNLLGRMPLDLTCLDLDPDSNVVATRLGGIKTSVDRRVERIRGMIEVVETELLTDDAAYWSVVNDFQWLGNSRLVKVPVVPAQVWSIEKRLRKFDRRFVRRYSVGGNQLWLGWPNGESITKLAGFCSTIDRAALPILGSWPDRMINNRTSAEFERRIAGSFMPKR